MNLFTKLSEEEFLENYWEQRPHVFRNVISSPQEIVNPEHLIAMAEDDYYETRLITHNKKRSNWEISDGPFEAQRFADHDALWTLAVHNLDLYSEEIIECKESLNFLPKWPFDDVMGTYSTPNASVGAHIDNYNVFIMQTIGSRKWQLQTNPSHEYIENLPVRVLKQFEPDQEYILNPGDVIYIPPHIAHHGISQSLSISFSFGYKSIEDKKLLDQYALTLLNEFESETFYRFNSPENSGFTISEKISDDLYTRLQNLILNKELFKKSLGQMASESKRPNVLEDEILTPEQFCTQFKTEPLYKDEFVRYCKVDVDGEIKLFINSKEQDCKPFELEYFQSIADLNCQEEINFKTEKLVPFLYKLYAQGILIFAAD